MKEYQKLSELYNQIVLNEAKVDNKKGKVEGAVPVGKPVTSETPKMAKGTGPEAVKNVDKPEEDTKNSNPDAKSRGKAETVKMNDNVNIFDKLYNSVINEAEDPLDEIPEVQDAEAGMEGEGDLGGEDELAGDNDLVARLSALRDEIDGIIMDLEGGTEEEEMPDEDIGGVEGEAGVPPVTEESTEADGRPVELKTKGETLQSGQDVKGSKIKAKGDKASIPANKAGSARPTPLGKKNVGDWKSVAKGPQGSAGANLIQ